MDLQTNANNNELNSALLKITIISPLNNSHFSNPPLVQINISDTYEINQTWYLIIGSDMNKTFNGNSVEIDINLWQMHPDGIITIRFYANNSIGQEDFTDLQVIKDTIKPTIIIHSPQNGTIVREGPPYFNVTVSDVNFHKFWFIINTSEEIYFWYINPGNNIVYLPFSEWKTVPQGYLLFSFFVNDTVGNNNNSDLMIIKKLTERTQKIPGIHSSALFLVLIITSTLIIIISIRKSKKL